MHQIKLNGNLKVADLFSEPFIPIQYKKSKPIVDDN